VTISACCSAIRTEKIYFITLEEREMGPSAPKNLTAFVFSEDASLSDATTNWSQEYTWTSVVSVAGTRLHVNQSEEELNGHRLSLNGLLDMQN